MININENAFFFLSKDSPGSKDALARAIKIAPLGVIPLDFGIAVNYLMCHQVIIMEDCRRGAITIARVSAPRIHVPFRFRTLQSKITVFLSEEAHSSPLPNSSLQSLHRPSALLVPFGQEHITAGLHLMFISHNTWFSIKGEIREIFS